jgi:hypothetical protein
MSTPGEINSNFYQIVDVDVDGNPTQVKNQYIAINTIANSNYANFAGTAYNVSVSNVAGIGNIATINKDGNASHVLYGNGVFANLPTVTNVANANYSNFAGTAYSVNGANVTGTVANANHANVSNSANSVAVANVVGIGNIATINLNGNGSQILAGNGSWISTPSTANANYANYAGNAFSVSGSNVSGDVAGANHANVADSANSVAVANVVGIGNIATVNLDGSSSNILFGNGVFAGITVPPSANANYANYAGNAFSVDGANVNGQVANANYANYAGNAFSVDGANVNGQVANANYASYAGNVTVAAQPNITSTGTLTSLNVTGNVTASRLISNVASGTAPLIVNSGTRVANLNVSYSNISDYLTRGTATSSTTYYLPLANNNTGNTRIFISDNFKYITNSNAGGVDGTLYASNFSGSGSLLTNITGANVTGTVANANYANYSNVANSANSVAVANVVGIGNIATINLDGNVSNVLSGTGTWISVGTALTANYANYAGNVTVNAQPNITSLGTLVSLDVSGNITSGNASLGNLVTANYVSGNGSLLSSITGANVTGTVANATYAASAGSATTAGTVTTNAQPNITSTGTLISLDVTGNISSGNANLGNLTTSNYFTGNGSLLSSITGANVTGTVANATYATSAGSATTAGTVTTGAQPNITSTGTLVSLTVTGNTTSGNIISSGFGNIANVIFTKYNENVVSGGSVSGTLTPNAAAGTIYNYTLTGNITLNSLSNAVAGTSMVVILTQGGSGSYTLTSTMKFAGASKTLSTAVGAIDIVSVFYDGTTYYATLSKGYA